MAGNVGRTGSAKTNQDNLFITNSGGENRGSVKDALKIGPHKMEWFVAVADGHGQNGHFVSQFISQHMPKLFDMEKKRLERSKAAKELASNKPQYKEELSEFE